MNIQPLSPAIGIEVRGFDLAHPPSEESFDAVREAWEENCVVLFRGQQLSVEQQVEAARKLGAFQMSRKGPPPVVQVTNARVPGEIPVILPAGDRMDFHSDQSYLDDPCAATMLYAIDIPRRGGTTLFSNGFRAYETLSVEVKERLAGREALHIYNYKTDPYHRPHRLPDENISATHPVFRPYRATNRKSLYVNRLMTWSIVGMPPEESRATLEMLFVHQERAEFVYEHVWRPGDVLLWDNRSCNHARTGFDSTELRRLRRVTLSEAPSSSSLAF